MRRRKVPVEESHRWRCAGEGRVVRDVSAGVARAWRRRGAGVARAAARFISLSKQRARVAGAWDDPDQKYKVNLRSRNAAPLGDGTGVRCRRVPGCLRPSLAVAYRFFIENGRRQVLRGGAARPLAGERAKIQMACPALPVGHARGRGDGGLLPLAGPRPPGWPTGYGLWEGEARLAGPGRAGRSLELIYTRQLIIFSWGAGAWLAPGWLDRQGLARAEVGIGVGLRGLRGLRQWAAPRLHRPRCRCVGPVGGLVGPAAELGVVCG